MGTHPRETKNQKTNQKKTHTHTKNKNKNKINRDTYSSTMILVLEVVSQSMSRRPPSSVRGRVT